MSIKRTRVEFEHDTGYGENLLDHINQAISGKDMRAVRIVPRRLSPEMNETDQNRLIDALTNLVDECIRKQRCTTYEEWQLAIEATVRRFVQVLHPAPDIQMSEKFTTEQLAPEWWIKHLLKEPVFEGCRVVEIYPGTLQLIRRKDNKVIGGFLVQMITQAICTSPQAAWAAYTEIYETLSRELRNET